MRMVFNFIIGFVVVGLGVAILQAFDWNFIAVIEWFFGITMGIVNAIAHFFTGHPIFQEYVVK